MISIAHSALCMCKAWLGASTAHNGMATRAAPALRVLKYLLSKRRAATVNMSLMHSVHTALGGMHAMLMQCAHIIYMCNTELGYVDVLC
jgi:hypothetical protein